MQTFIRTSTHEREVEKARREYSKRLSQAELDLEKTARSREATAYAAGVKDGWTDCRETMRGIVKTYMLEHDVAFVKTREQRTVSKARGRHMRRRGRQR